MTSAQGATGFGDPENPATVPVAARWLGGTGAIPFAGLAFLCVFAPESWSNWAAQAIAFYGAVILSFLGGIQWGLAISNTGATDNQVTRLTLSVVPSLIAWAGLLLPLSAGLLVMVAAFALVLYQDVAASRSGDAPSWYPKLRMPLSLVVMASLLVGLMGTLI
ncbi:DUF3429 domain-containing protein [Roseibium porphyridii]|uniref:DUF3429 domain-containing protein n=1 Tax=Roseibium porphyridii TaxID=2866279 RepID=A0ABY8F2A3_9HYPH|nr:DUF3429 domain-containing protein [Roseibium sp. KMA01]WFE89618.1 DUF3429 domain-containing protein [Roseibium sp. KMA01]